MTSRTEVGRDKMFLAKEPHHCHLVNAEPVVAFGGSVERRLGDLSGEDQPPPDHQVTDSEQEPHRAEVHLVQLVGAPWGP